MHVHTPYEDFPQISKDCVEEISFRMRSACAAIEIFEDYKHKRPKTEIEFNQFKSIRYILVRFAMLELCAALDGSGNMSLVLSKNRKGRYSVQPARLKRLFPKMPANELAQFQSKLDSIIGRNSKLVGRLLHTRNKRIAHAGSISTRFDPIALSSRQFPKARCYALASEINAIIWEVTFGIELLSRMKTS